jgi:hypothetical protein
MSILLSGLVNGADKIEEENVLARNLLLAVVFYTVITLICSLFFGSLVVGITEAI